MVIYVSAVTSESTSWRNWLDRVEIVGHLDAIRCLTPIPKNRAGRPRDQVLPATSLGITTWLTRAISASVA